MANGDNSYNKLWIIYLTKLFVVMLLVPQSTSTEDNLDNNGNLNILHQLQEIENNADLLKGKLINIRDEVDELIDKLDRLLLTKIDNIKECGHIRPPTKKNEKLIRLENKIGDIQNNITALVNEFAQNNEDISEIKPRINNLEDELELLKKQLDSERRNVNEDIGKYEGNLQNLTSKYNKVSVELKHLINEYKEREFRKLLQKLIDECVTAIRNGNYEVAVEKLNLITDDNKIYDVIEEVYKHEVINNFDLILKFGNEVSISKSFLVFKALYNEMTKHGDNDGLKILQLIESMNMEIINRTLVQQSLKEEAIDLVNVLKSKLKQAGLDDLRNQILYGNLNNQNELADRIYFLDKSLYEEMYVKFVKDVYKSHSNIVKNLLILTRNRPNIEQLVIGFTNIFYEMLNNHDLNNAEIINLANYVHDVQTSNNYNELSDERKQTLEDLKYSLPKSVKNLVFAGQLCIKNVGRNEYLYAASGANNAFLYDNDRRIVFTWVGGERVDQGGWSVTRNHDNKYYIYNNYHREYMYAAEFGRDSDRRFVFTWVPGGYDFQGEWEIEPDGDNCYIKNTHFNEYLYASNYKFDIIFNWQRRRVFTWKPEGRNLADIYWLWYIEECNTFVGV